MTSSMTTLDRIYKQTQIPGGGDSLSCQMDEK